MKAVNDNDDEWMWCATDIETCQCEGCCDAREARLMREKGKRDGRNLRGNE